MKIAIDISQIIYGTGVSTYTKELVKNLLEIDNTNEYVLYGGSLRRAGELKNFVADIRNPLSQKRIFRIPPALADLLWNRIRLVSIDNLIGKVDVFHSSDWSQPPTKAFKVTTVHDLAPFKFAELTPKKIRKVHSRRLRWVKKEVDRIIVPSRQTQDDLVEMGVDPSKIRVIFEAASNQLTKASTKDVEAVKKKYKLDRYLLSVGINPRKNTNRIIEAFGELSRHTKIKLVLVGQPHNISIEKSESFIVLGHVSNPELSALYTGAEVFVYPSLYEGFGIPILDAMKAETPVVTSNLGSMKEVAGNSAVLVNPESVISITNGIREAMRLTETLTNKGKKRYKQFSWQKMAKETLDLYCQAKR